MSGSGGIADGSSVSTRGQHQPQPRRVHLADPFRIGADAIASGTACRPDGQHGVRLYASADRSLVTCARCLAVSR